MIILDTETTGLKPGIDELLQVSIINEHGDLLFNRYIRPTRCTEWPDAMEINHITPEMVKDCPTIHEIRDTIQTLINEADKIIGYNTYFDLAFLAESGIDVPDSDSGKIIDVMIDFAEVYGDYREDLGGYKWQKLTTAAAYYGFEWPINAHNSLGDCLATLHVYNSMQQQQHLRPCPFCGSDRVHLVDRKALIRCEKCLVEISVMGRCFADDIIAAYNRRASDETHGTKSAKEYLNERFGNGSLYEDTDSVRYEPEYDDEDDNIARCDRCGTYVYRDTMYAGICAECQAEDEEKSKKAGWYKIEEIIKEVLPDA
jgi:DNA polymerase-3 subunit epsilon